MKDDSMTDDDIAAIARSDDRSWTKFYVIYAPIMCAYAAHRGSSEPDDVVQEVMVKFYKAVRDGRFHAKTGADCTAYMKSLVRTRVIDDYRRARARCGDKTIELDEFAVPALDGASTQGDTMDELKYMLIDLAKIYTEEK